MAENSTTMWHGTTILCVRKGPEVVIAGDGQVSLGQTKIKSNARKVRRMVVEMFWLVLQEPPLTQ